MVPIVIGNQKNKIMESHEVPSLQYFLASLAGIARALEEFGYRDEAGQLFRVKNDLEAKVASPKKE